MSGKLVVNVGGEGEHPGVINQQGPWCMSSSWLSSREGKTFKQLVDDGIVFLICPNIPLAFPDDSVDRVLTEGVLLDAGGSYGPGVQSSEIHRILKPGGEWYHEGNLTWTKQ